MAKLITASRTQATIDKNTAALNKAMTAQEVAKENTKTELNIVNNLKREVTTLVIESKNLGKRQIAITSNLKTTEETYTLDAKIPTEADNCVS